MAEVTPNAGYGYAQSTVTTYNGTFVIRPVAVYGATTTGSYGTPAAEPVIDKLANDPLRHVAVAMNPDDYYQYINNTSTGARIRNIRIITPLAMFQRIADTTANVAMYSPSSQGIPEVLWIASRYDLGFNLSTNRTLLTLGNSKKAIALQVTGVYHIDPETDHIRVKHKGHWYQYYPGMPHSYGSYMPRVEVVGGACYLYKVEAIQVADPNLRQYWRPLRSDQDFFNWPVRHSLAWSLTRPSRHRRPSGRPKPWTCC